jgi:signal transduction histidine kinase
MRLRLLLSFFLIVLVTIFSMVLVVRLSTEREVRAWMFRGGMLSIESLVGELEDYYRQHGSWEGVDSLFRTQGRGRGMGPGMMGQGMLNQRLRLADPQGLVLIDTTGAALESQLSELELANAIPLESGKQVVGYLIPEGGLSLDLPEESSLLSGLNRAALISALVAGALALLLALLLAYWLLRPVADLRAAAVALAAGDLRRRVPARGTGELAELSRVFNHMAISLEHAEATRRDMTADIAHELRTPLAVQRAHLEALQDGVYPLSTANLAPILEQNLLLTRLVEDLRTLALADAGQLRLDRVPTDLPALARRVQDRFQPQAASKEIHLSLHSSEAELPQPLVDPGRLEQVLANLLTNALRHTPEGGQIDLSIRETGVLDLPQAARQVQQAAPHALQISVRDNGPGIPEEALPRVFERFYRAGRSRSREEGGTGLGLAIARQIAEAHGGSLSAANHPEGGAVFILTLPLQ